MSSDYKFLDTEEEEKYLNDRVKDIVRFEIIDSYYLRIYMNDGTFVEVEPEYGAIYFKLNQSNNTK